MPPAAEEGGGGAPALSSAKAITEFAIVSPAATGTIDENARTIFVAVPYGTNVTALVATLATTGASIKVGATEQVSGTTPNDFMDPVVYRVTAADGAWVDYTATVTFTVSVSGTITLPYAVTAKCYFAAISASAGGGPVAGVTGQVNGPTISYTIDNVPPGNYYLLAGVDNDASSASSSLCSWPASLMPTSGDFGGYYGTSSLSQPSAPNATIYLAFGQVFNFSLYVLP